MSAKIPLAPIVEEIANRYGFFEFDNRGALGPLEISVAAVQNFQFFGCHLKITDLMEHLPVSLSEDQLSVVFPQVIETSEVASWRHTTREFFRILAEENPRILGREELRRWDRPRTPEAGLEELPLSESFLDRTYVGEFIVREKKQLVADYRRSQGNYLASVDDEGNVPAVLLMDASSQIASHLVGFNGRALRGVAAHPESYQNLDYRFQHVPAEAALRAILLRWAPEGLDHVAWCNSGTESWEKAVYLAQQKFPDKGPKCVCFKGSFHGRTLISLFSSWNPVKRLPFELKGYETLWAEFPEDKEPHLAKNAEPQWLALWEGAGEATFTAPEIDPHDLLLAAEVESLLEVRQHLLSGEVSSVSVEPMQCEGGDRFASNRFFQTLRVLTRAMGVALIFDEVQTGFGLGGHELWSNSFALVSSKGEPLPPDFINLAKKCQVGAVLSSVPDAYRTSAHAASFARGYINAVSVNARALTALGERVRERLFVLAEQYDFVGAPRAQGLAFAFDMPDAAYANNFVNQRFYHGFMVYIAGETTLRFRIQYSTTPEDLDHIFRAIEESLRHLENHGPDSMPARYDYVWQASAGPDHPIPATVEEMRRVDWDVILKAYGELSARRRQEMSALLEPKPLEQYGAHYRDKKFTWLELLRYLAGRQSIRIRPLNAGNWAEYKDQIMELEHTVYEPARVDEESFLQMAVESERTVSFVAFERERLLGFSIAAPLELFKDVRGPNQDPGMGTGKYLYSADVLVHPDARGRGLGLRLKRRQLERAHELGFVEVRSRNRVGLAGTMSVVNKSLGALEINYFEKDYGEEQSPCRYVSMPLYESAVAALHWSSGVENPTGGLLPADSWGDWDLAAINKNSLCNWWTPNMTRYVEWLRSVSPLGHVYLASGRDEAVDKLVKCLIYNRKGATKMVSFQGSFWGGVTACARSLSDPKFGKHFDWHHVAYPYQEGDPFLGIGEPLTEPEIDALEQLGNLLVEPEKILGIAVEPVQEKTGRRVSVRFLQALRSLCDDTGVPLVMNESACWAYRGSREMFYCQATGVKPDLLTAFAGGQLGHVFCNDKYYIEKPLTMISTWDGDELSALRLREQVAMLREHRDDPRLFELDRMVGARGDTYRGSGLLFFDGEALDCEEDLHGDGHLFWPPLNRLSEEWDRFEGLFAKEKVGAEN